MSNVHTDIAQDIQKEASTMNPMTRLIRLLCGLLGAALLAAIFAAYLRPSFMLDLGTRFIMCF